MILVHVAAPLSYPAGVWRGGTRLLRGICTRISSSRLRKIWNRALWPELDGIAVTRLLLRGDPAHEIVKTARDRNVDLIVMPTHRDGPFYRFLLGSVTVKVLHESHCPVWRGAHLEETPVREFSIRRVLCSVDLSPHSVHTAKVAADVAAAVDATFTLVHITSGVESGNVPELLNRTAEQTKADVLVLGHIPGRSDLGGNGNGYGIIRESHIPVLSV